MKKKSFTLVEILIGLIIVAVLASLSIVTYQKSVETNNNRICLDNLKILQGALDIYTLENNVLPTTLAQLSPRHLYLAEQKVIAPPKANKLVTYFRNLFGVQPALAQSLAKYYANQRNVFVCPNHIDPTDPTHKPIDPPPNSPCDRVPIFPPGGSGSATCGSYTFNFTDGKTTIIDINNHRHLNPNINEMSALIFDSANMRHRERNGLTRNGITPNGRDRGRIDADGKVKR